MKQLTSNHELQGTLNSLFDNAVLRSAGISDQQANTITFNHKPDFRNIRHTLSDCCFAPVIKEGQEFVCSECNLWCELS